MPYPRRKPVLDTNPNEKGKDVGKPFKRDLNNAVNNQAP